MPSFCCVPKCTQKGYKTSEGLDVSFFNFPKDKDLRKQWIVAIKRDVGPDFNLTDRTKICSLHFKDSDLKKSLSVRLNPAKGAVPSTFAWYVSPRKRKAPAVRAPLPSKTAHSAVDSVDDLSDEAEGEINVPLESEHIVNTVQDPDQIQPDREDEPCTEELKEKLKEMEQDLEECRKSKDNVEIKTAGLKKSLDDLQKRYENTSARIFSLERFSSDSDINFYTGFPNYETFKAVFDFLNSGVEGENIRYWKRDVEEGFYHEGSDEEEEIQNLGYNKRGRPRKLKPADEFFIVLCRLRRGFSERHLANLFGVSQPCISRLFVPWINHMYLKFGAIQFWPSQQVVKDTMPHDFKEKYPSTRVIIDCTEIQCEMPSSLLLNSELFSSYKHRVTLKGLIGIAPSGAITFISQLYTGSISDREIVVRSGFLYLEFNNGDSIMADKGFTIEDLLPLGTTLNIPPFLGANTQMSAEEVLKTQEIASLRIHVERAINKIKNFLIWDGVVPLSLFGVVNQMWTVSAFLCNLHDPLITM